MEKVEDISRSSHEELNLKEKNYGTIEEECTVSVQNETIVISTKYSNVIVFLIIILGIVVGQVNVSMVAPGFPLLALTKGISPGQQSFVFNTPDITGLVSMLILGKLTPYIGVKLMLVTGVLATGALSCMFGSLEYSPGGVVFFISAILIRAVEGVMTYSVLSSSTTFLMCMFPEKAALMMTISEILMPVSFSIGPLIGSVLFQSIGYMCTFVAIGLFGICIGILGAFILKPIKRQVEDVELNWWHYIKNSTVIFSLIQCLNGFQAGAYFINILSLHFTTLGANMYEIGGVYAGYAFSFSLSSLIFNQAASRFPKCIPYFTVAGLGLQTVLMILIGPAEFLNLPLNGQKTIIFFLCLYNATVGIFSMHLVLLNSYISELGLEENMASKAMVSTLGLFAVTLGICVAPLISGYTYEARTFAFTATVQAYIQMFFFILALLYYIVIFCMSRRTYTEVDYSCIHEDNFKQ